jgi:hypothetical protein
MRSAPNAAVHRFALVAQLSLAARVVAVLVLLVIVSKFVGGF